MGLISTLKITPSPFSSPIKNWHLVVSLFNGGVNFQRPEEVILQRIFSWEMTGRVIFQWGSIYNTPAGVSICRGVARVFLMWTPKEAEGLGPP